MKPRIPKPVRVALAVVGGMLFLFGAFMLMGAQTDTVPNRSALPTRVTTMPVEWSRTQTTTCGNLSNEVTSLTVYTTSSMVAIWCTGEAALVNWWSTAKTDLGTTNAWLVVEDVAPAVFDHHVLGESTASSVILWFASQSATSAVVSLLEFTYKE